ncbi:SRPBCC domain-containing protein [Streptomyces sp. ME02-6979.5a]|uniref:SRPBCC family protein n=1 Tax=Streptomyces sp. ME02-6979.5a TaxID=462925 RepID=UPI0029BAAAAF|nr:SRPBCC domain-containing protein [Streptomyces sp. ME02-6979.5a]MDX3337041.1 SRPBCC domain-containing protein [Streptomyces sp. ME02-6979.5a]
MEHEVFVPVPVPTLLRTLGDPARVARCVPGLQQDADAASPLAGRLKLRAGGHTITYRGELRLTGPERDRFSVTGKGVEARGTGAVEVALTIGLTAADGGTTLTYSGTATGDGRLVELEEGAALAAAHRLLDRFTQQLVTESLAERDEGEEPGAEDRTVVAEGLEGDEVREGGEGGEGGDDGMPSPEADADADAEELALEAEDEAEAGAGGDDSGAGAGAGSVFDSPVPPPSLDPVAGVEFTVPDEPPAEAAHARRTMIGRSAEEVDHAPPRGRYAPVPSPDAGGASTTLRWVAPAAALALASAVVLGRALRRRR